MATFTYDLDVLFGLPNGRSNFLGSAATDRDVYKLDIGSNTERPILALLLYNLSRDVDIALYADSDRNGVFNSDFDVSLRRSVNSGTQNDLIRFDTLSTASPNGLYFAVVTPFAQSSGSGQFNYTISASKIQQPLPSGASVNFTTLSSRSPSFEINTEVRGELIGAISSNQTNSVIFATVYADSNTNGIFDSADSLFSNKTYTYTIANQAQALSITIPAGKSFLNLRSAGSNPITTVTGAFSAWGKKMTLVGMVSPILFYRTYLKDGVEYGQCLLESEGGMDFLQLMVRPLLRSAILITMVSLTLSIKI